MPDEGIASTLAEALEMAESEFGEATPNEAPAGLPPVGTEEPQASDEAPAEPIADQPEAGKVETENPLDLLKDRLEAEAPAALDWSTEVQVETVNGTETVKLEELKAGYLRQADYTKKTQEVARERDLVTDAVEFYGAFQKDPSDFARYLAVKAGLVEGDEGPAKEGVKLYSEADLQAAIDEKVEERLKEHPLVQEAATTAQVQQVQAQFAAIEDKFKVDLNDGHKRMILQRALADKTDNLTTVFQALLYEAAAIERETARVAGASTGRPSRAPDGATDEVPKVDTVGDAMALALEELSA